MDNSIKYISYSKWNRMGRLGNMLFELSALFSMSKRYNRELFLPQPWLYQDYFEINIKIGESLPFNNDITEPSFTFPGWQYWDKKFQERNNDKIISISGWTQSNKYWEGLDIKEELFKFKQEFFFSVRERYKDIFDTPEEVIAISVRVGQDYKDNGNYEILPMSYYINALYDKFPEWNNGGYNILIFSDDMEYCKLNFTAKNMYFAYGNDIEQLCAMTMCNHFILANSTFSWWGAYLGQMANSKVVYPSLYYKGHLLQSCPTKDFWPKNWEMADAKKKLDLTDVTFTIPVNYDSNHRKENLNLLVKYLRKNFDCHILIGEQGGKYFREGEYDYIDFPYKEFHRTKMLNDMANEASTPIIVNQDADVLVPALQMYQAVVLARQGNSMIYPYDGRFARVDRVPYYNIVNTELDCGYFKNSDEFRGCRDFDPKSVGGVIVWRKEDFIYGGMENENMINYGPEDVERWVRFEKLGYRIKRVDGAVYHIDHWVGANSGGAGNPHANNNQKELERIQAMTNNQLLDEIAKWSWVNTYMSGYYEEITDGGVKSAREALKRWEKKISSVLDIGCGVGAWSKGCLWANYRGVDHKIPKHKLVFPIENYHEYDLTSNGVFPFHEKFDLVICMEVAEHIDKKHAKNLVNLICRMGREVLFSAAIPHQGGTGHVNEQWQTYWAKLFYEEGFYPIIPYDIRNNENIENWYRQNAVIYTPLWAEREQLRDFVLPEMYTNIIGSLTNWK